MIPLQNLVTVNNTHTYQVSMSPPTYSNTMTNSCYSLSAQNSLPTIILPQAINQPHFILCNQNIKMNPSLQLIKTNGQKPLRIRKKLNTPRKKFTPSEDEKLKNLVETMGSKKWE